MLLIVSGQLDLDDGTNRMSMDTPASLLLVEPNTCADLLKTPGGTEQCFRSVFLTFPAALLDGFHRDYPATRTGPRPASPFRSAALDRDLTATLCHVLESVEESSLSDERLRHRLMDLLLALAERGHCFGHADLDSTSGRLRTLIGEAPERHWTAEVAGKELAMSAATLRRRLASEHARFEDLLIDVRMHHAMMLVQTTAWAMTRIAEACGYKSRARFAERFQDRFGYPPSTVR
ncbi:helix-turn-helix domain-containing protein [Trinickia terrae]|uniref:helix-turn-helix domain-containing protein n=1 Tax=Trinickia terrae TaxID=2571161 RepID=UPI001F0D7EAE|nr:helix-turn-helix domain-containing protein [Trinickia terrae]